ncbi:MAG: hypothetical protein PHR75_02825 [Sulfurovum sp.]|nr:hypothetical protein [Sulfurovum sp.]MDD3602850.1 hypothetical protein [Sulfurovum sp.]
MSRHRIISVFIAVFALFVGTAQAKELMVLSEDEMIIRGLFYEEIGAFEQSRAIYGKLFDTTGDEVYLFKEVASSLLGKTNIPQSITRLKSWDKKHPETLEVKRLLIPLYLVNNNIKEAKKEAEYLLERSDTPIDMELASNPFLYTGEFKRALEILSKVYEKTANEEILLRMSVIMDEYTNEQKKAIQLLEMHRRMHHDSSNEVYLHLLSLYVKQNDIDGILETYKALYAKDPKKEFLAKIIDAYAYKKDIDGAIEFLEANNEGKDILYVLYKEKKEFKKAITLADQFYENEKDARWLAEKGILLFEEAKDKNNKEMIQEVISCLEKAIAMGVDDSVYLNYYGYTLIDKEIDIKKGIKIIEDALVQQPNNPYYLDSLAWGYYKTHQCKKAYEMMKKVVEQEGLEEPEIAEHWEKIQKCK